MAISVIASLMIAVMACGESSNPADSVTEDQAPATLRIAGAGGASAVLASLAEEYSTQFDDIKFVFLDGSGSSGGVKGVNSGVLDIGAMSRAPKEAELATGIAYESFAEDRVSIVVSPDVIISDLTSVQIKGIFTGEITNWSEVNGPNAAIKVVVREESDSNTAILRAGILGQEEFSRSAVVMTSESDTKAALDHSTQSVGYIAYSGFVIDQLKVNVVSIDGHHPTVGGNLYPLAPRVLGVAYLPANEDQVKKFVNFIKGSTAGEVLVKRGLIGGG